ncbi:MAG: shikimate dehydrogenase [Neisseriaceae bacterium]|nr:MAG: shikimate dehydrogenase [Neisseriaceae bacterium]
MKYQLAVFGNPIEHSLSPRIHTMFAEQFNLPIKYEKMLVVDNNLPKAVNAFRNQGGNGANITVPFKEDAFHFSSKLSERAQKAKAVNTLIMLEQNEWLGDNTDGIGLVNDILSKNIHLKNQRILIIGAGGASRGIIFPLLMEKPHSITITNRTIDKAKLLAKEFDIDFVNFEDAHEKSYDIIINATSSSLKKEPLNISSKIFDSCQLVYDMMYGKKDIPFLIWAKKSGVSEISDGLGMLAYQAAESFCQWTQLTPDVNSVILKLK